MDWEPAGDPQPLSVNEVASPSPTGKPPPVPRDQIVKFWGDKGAPDHVAQGIADSVYAESGVRGTDAYDPTAVNPKSGAAGLYQDLGPRKAALTALPDWQDPATQNNFAFKEVTGGDPEATKHWNEIKSAETREEAAALWTRYFERSRPSSSTATIAAGNWNVSPAAIAAEQRSDADVLWMSPGEYLAMTPPIAEGESQSARARSLARSLDAGDDIETIPTLDVKHKGDTLQVYDQDGRNRAAAAQNACVDLIPVAVNGVKSAEIKPQAIVDMRGKTHPYDFESVLGALNPIGSARAAEAGMSWQPAGPPQPIAATPWAASGSQEPIEDYERGRQARKLQPDWFGMGVRTDLGAATAFASHLLPQGVVDTINSINNRLASLGAPLATVPPGGIDEMERQRLAGLQAQRGPSPTFGEMAGEAAPLLAMGGVGAGASLLGRIGIGAGLGALGGLLSPSTAQSYWPEKTGQIGTGALLGAIAAPAVDAIMPLARWAARLAGFSKPTAAADAVISRIAQSPAAPTAQDMLDVAAASAKPLTLADMSKRLANLAGRVSRSPGPAADIVAQNLAARASARGARIYGDVAGEFGGGDLHDATVALSQARSAAARPLFEAALQPGSTAPLADMFRQHAQDAMADYKAAVIREQTALREGAGRATSEMQDARADAEGRLRQIQRALADAQAAQAAGIRGAVWSPGLQKIVDLPVMQAGIRKGIDIERMRSALPGAGPFRPRDLAITGHDAQGEPVVSKVLNMRVLHAAKTGLDTILEGYRSPITGQLQLDNWGYAAQQVRRALVGELRGLNPSYAKAEDAWAGPSAQIEAARWGSKILTMDKNAIRDRMARFSPDEQEFARLGVGSMLRDYLEKTNASPARIGSLLSDLYRGRLEPVFRTPEDFSRFAKALRDERTMAQTDTRVLGNSLTAERVAEDRGPTIQHGVMLGADMLRGHPLGAIYNASRLLSNLARGSSPGVDADIARLLTTPLSQGSPGMALLQNAASMLPKTRAYLGGFAAGPAGLAVGGMQ